MQNLWGELGSIMENKTDLKTNMLSVRFPIGVKLAFIIGLIVLVSLSSLTFLTSYLMSEDVKITAENNNLSTNTRASGTVAEQISSIKSNVFQLLDIVDSGLVSGDREARQKTLSLFFERNPDIACISILGADSLNGKNLPSKIENAAFFKINDISSSAVDDFILSCEKEIIRSSLGETLALNPSPFFNMSVLSLFFPWKENGKDECILVIFNVENFSDILFSDSINTTFVVNDSGELLIHPDTDRLLVGESMKNMPFVKLAISEGLSQGEGGKQILFENEDENGKKEKYYGAYQKNSAANIFVMTTVPLSLVLEQVNSTKINNILLTVLVFFLSVILILCFSRYAISLHLRRLSQAALEIQKGNFETKILSDLNYKRQDEIGVLNRSTKNELDFLNIFAKFTNRSVAKLVARNEIDFAPHLKDLTIFFSDVVDFTQLSNDFHRMYGNDSPKEIISFLNDYMGRMVNCITLSGGNVDKFEGDAIMAVWGLLRDENLDFENMDDDNPQKALLAEKHRKNVAQDALNGIRGAVAMRYSLLKYNKDAEKYAEEHFGDKELHFKPQLKIGCGLNTGRATAGILGSNDKMEYTAIGDAVNLASRTESATRVCETDILISQDTYEILKEDYIRCKENNFTLLPENEENEIIVEEIPADFGVKGKGIRHFYGVVNMPCFDIVNFFRQNDGSFEADSDCLKAVGKNGPKTLKEVRQLLGMNEVDYSKVDLNEEEVKVWIENGRN